MLWYVREVREIPLMNLWGFDTHQAPPATSVQVGKVQVPSVPGESGRWGTVHGHRWVSGISQCCWDLLPWGVSPGTCEQEETHGLWSNPCHRAGRSSTSRADCPQWKETQFMTPWTAQQISAPIPTAPVDKPQGNRFEESNSLGCRSIFCWTQNWAADKLRWQIFL